LETKDRTVNVRLPCQDRGVVDEITGWKIVGPVDDHIEFAKQLKCILAGQLGFERFDRCLRVNVLNSIRRRGNLCPANVFCSVNYLPLKIRFIDDVEIDQPERTDAGRRQIKPERRAETSGADHQNAGRLKLSLPFEANLGKYQMARVTR